MRAGKLHLPIEPSGSLAPPPHRALSRRQLMHLVAVAVAGLAGIVLFRRRRRPVPAGGEATVRAARAAGGGGGPPAAGTLLARVAARTPGGAAPGPEPGGVSATPPPPPLTPVAGLSVQVRPAAAEGSIAELMTDEQGEASFTLAPATYWAYVPRDAQAPGWRLDWAITTALPDDTPVHAWAEATVPDGGNVTVTLILTILEP